MKSMKNFAAQQLTKKQMNEVKGGGTDPNQLWECHWEGGMTIIAEKDFPRLAIDLERNGLEEEVTCHMI